MRGLWHGYHAANVLLRLNADLLLFGEVVHSEDRTHDEQVA